MYDNGSQYFRFVGSESIIKKGLDLKYSWIRPLFFRMKYIKICYRYRGSDPFYYGLDLNNLDLLDPF